MMRSISVVPLRGSPTMKMGCSPVVSGLLASVLGKAAIMLSMTARSVAESYWIRPRSMRLPALRWRQPAE